MKLRPVVRALRADRSVVRGIPVHRVWIGDVDVTAATIGVGPAAAARSTVHLLDASATDVVLVSGVAGGLDPQVPIGTVVVPATVVNRGSGRRLHATPVKDVDLAGTIATSHELVVDEERQGALRAEGVDAVDMETAAVAEVCSDRGLPWLAFRGISDRPSDGLVDGSMIGMLKPDGRANPLAMARFVAMRPWKIPGLVRLGRDATLAARRAAEAAVAACGRL